MAAADFDTVMEVVRQERAYQHAKWGDANKGASLARYIELLGTYVARADKAGLSLDEVAQLHEVRKVVALGVACLEQHGAPARPPIIAAP
jgi:hypothetical protein